MEKLRNLRIPHKKKILFSIGTAVLALSLSSSGNSNQAEGKAPYEWTPYEGPFAIVVPPETASPIRISENINAERKKELTGENRDNSSGGIHAVDIFPSPSPATLKSHNKPENLTTQLPEQIKNIESQFEAAKQKIISHPEIFSQKWEEDFNIYGRIYMEVSEKFTNVDWFLLMDVHEAETGASNSDAAFNGGTLPYVYGMQRDPAYWPESYVEQAAKGLEYLAKLPQRHSNDWREIATAANEISDNINQYKNLGEEKSVLNALLLYSADGPAEERFNRWLVLKDVFKKTNG